MCELFGITGVNEVNVDNYLKEFFSHSVEHHDGWGMAQFHGNEVSLEKEPIAAYKSKYLKNRIGKAIETRNMFAHIRLATKGGEDFDNCHPFVKRDRLGRTWTLMHNGTIFACPKLDEYFCQQKGRTDSERILLYVVDKINEKIKAVQRELDAEERFEVIEKVVFEITEGNNKVNLLIYDGELTYIHTNQRETLYYSELPGSVVFATTPLDRAEWNPVELTTLLAYKDNKIVFRGQNHEHEYHYNYEDVKYLYLDISEL